MFQFRKNAYTFSNKSWNILNVLLPSQFRVDETSKNFTQSTFCSHSPLISMLKLTISLLALKTIKLVSSTFNESLFVANQSLKAAKSFWIACCRRAWLLSEKKIFVPSANNTTDALWEFYWHHWDVNDKKEGSKDRILRDTALKFTNIRVYSLKRDKLLSVGEIANKPRMESAANTVVK